MANPVGVYDVFLGGSNIIRQVTRSNYAPNGSVRSDRLSGAPDPSARYGGQAAPMVGLESMDVAGVLGFCSPTAGLAIDNTTMTVPYQVRANRSTFAGSGSHPSLTASYGLLVPTSSEVSQDGDGSISLDLHFHSSDGFTNPITANVNQNLTAQAYNALFTLGPGYINGTLITNCIGWSVNFGISVEKDYNDGAQYPQAIYITERDPSISYRFKDMAALNAFTNCFLAATSAAVYMRKRSGASYVAAATGQHIKYSFGTGMILADSGNVERLGLGEVAFTVHGLTLSSSVSSTIGG